MPKTERNDSDPPSVDDCRRCGKSAAWSGSRSMSEENITMWWNQRKEAAKKFNYEMGSVLCGACETELQQANDTCEVNEENGVPRTKRLILIRHAESENNVDKREAKLAWNNIKHGIACPSFSQVCSAGRLLTIPMNTDLSNEGEIMVEALRKKLQDMNFLINQNVELIVHSPLIRARKTCHGLFSSGGNLTHSIPILENSDIFEKNISETLSLADMNIRIEAFREYLLGRDEACIVVVGHSAFFRAFLNTRVGLKNCEVGVVEFTDKGECKGSIETLVEGGTALIEARI